MLLKFENIPKKWIYRPTVLTDWREFFTCVPLILITWNSTNSISDSPIEFTRLKYARSIFIHAKRTSVETSEFVSNHHKRKWKIWIIIRSLIKKRQREKWREKKREGTRHLYVSRNTKRIENLRGGISWLLLSRRRSYK